MNRNSENKARYDAKATKRYGLKLNLKTDAAVIKKLDAAGSMQGYIKDLVNQDIDMSLFIRAIVKMDREGYILSGLSTKDENRIAVMTKGDEEVLLKELRQAGSILVEKAGEVVDVIHP